MSGPADHASLPDLASVRLARTDEGQHEIAARALTLTRPGRNLLLIIDAKRSAADWLGMVRGSTPDDLLQLLAAGLVAPVGGVAAPVPSPAPASPAVVATVPPVPAGPSQSAAPAASGRMTLGEALQAQSYKLLYDRMTSEARAQLGLIKGYKLILEIERCNGPDEIRALALQFVDQVRALHGDVKGRALAQRLADPG